MHYLICGVSLSGKTTLAHWIARSLAAEKNPPRIIVYDPVHTKTAAGTWPEDVDFFDNRVKFLNWIEHLEKSERGYAIFIDESDLIFSHEQRENFWMLTKGRHRGFNIFLICQRPKMVSPSVRSQCGEAYVFRLSRDDLKSVGNDYAQEISHIDLDRGDFLCLHSGTSRLERDNIFSILKRRKPWASKAS